MILSIASIFINGSLRYRPRGGVHVTRRRRTRACDDFDLLSRNPNLFRPWLRSIHHPHMRSRSMFSIRKARPFVFTSVASVAVTLGVVFTYVAPASNVRPAPLEDRPGVASFSTTLRPWSD